MSFYAKIAQLKKQLILIIFFKKPLDIDILNNIHTYFIEWNHQGLINRFLLSSKNLRTNGIRV